MSEIIEKVSGIKHIPIFPLPLVMLPNELLPLHIFEDRYQQMLKDAAAGNKFFGVTLFEPDESFIDKPALGTVGCVAEIRESETMPDGRSNIITLGVVRYRLIDYVEEGNAYLVGDVHFFEDDKDEKIDVQPIADEVFGLFDRMARAAFKMGGSRGTFPQLQVTDPESLSFLITAAFNFDNDFKYRMIEMTSTFERLSKLRELLLKTVDQMEESANIQAVSRTNGHSKKKLDI